MNESFKNKKVLVFGLGLLGGGVATTNWLLKQGAKVTVTDTKDKQTLKSSLKNIKGKVKLSLGGHHSKDIDSADVIAVNPGVPLSNIYIKRAIRKGKTLVNETMLFYDGWPKMLAGVTGTRGKTTTAHWLNHFLNAGRRSTLAGNSSDHPFLKVLDRAKRYDIAVAETPSFQLELFGPETRTPDIAVITNISPDHLNHHGSMRAYVLAKANIFKHQKSDQCLILNADNPWTPFLLKQKPKAYVWFFSRRKGLRKNQNGLYYRRGAVHFQFGGKSQKVLDVLDFAQHYGEHNLENLLASSLAAYLAGVSGEQIRERIPTLPAVPLRQEIVFQNKKLTIINDTTATSPEGGIAAVRRFAGSHTVLITGGTDRQLDFKPWAKAVARYIKPVNIVLLSGSATDKMLKEFKVKNSKFKVFDTLKECLEAALKQAGKYPKSVVLFSPASKSFEKFKNEFDRGRKFNGLVKKWIRR